MDDNWNGSFSLFSNCFKLLSTFTVNKSLHMKKFRLTYYLFLISLTLFCSCETNIFGESEYHKFSNLDYQYIPEVYKQTDKIIEFINQNNETVQLKNFSYRIVKESYGGLLSEGESFYYDKLWIQLILVDAYSNCQNLDISISKSEKGDLFHRVTIPKFTGTSCGGTVFQFRSPETTEYSKVDLTINNQVYNDVLVLESSGSINNYFSMYKNSTIHKIYYDLKYGVIGFDDTTNNLEFRIKN